MHYWSSRFKVLKYSSTHGSLTQVNHNCKEWKLVIYFGNKMLKIANCNYYYWLETVVAMTLLYFTIHGMNLLSPIEIVLSIIKIFGLSPLPGHRQNLHKSDIEICHFGGFKSFLSNRQHWKFNKVAKFCWNKPFLNHFQPLLMGLHRGVHELVWR